MSERERHRPEAVGDILESVLDGLGLRARFAERRLLDDWAAIVGERIAAHCRAVDIADGVLVVDGDHGAWRQELTLLFPDIVRKYNRKYGADTVREIRWRSRGRGPRSRAGRSE